MHECNLMVVFWKTYQEAVGSTLYQKTSLEPFLITSKVAKYIVFSPLIFSCKSISLASLTLIYWFPFLSLLTLLVSRIRLQCRRLWLDSGSERSAGDGIGYPLQYFWASLVAQLVKNLPAMWETWVQSLGWEDPLEKGKATHCSYGLENSMDCIIQGVARVGHDWVTFTFTFLVCENFQFVPGVLADKYHIETPRASGCVYAATGVRRLSTCESTQVRQRRGEALGQGRTLPCWVFCWAPGYQGCWVSQAVIDFVANLRDQGCNLKHAMFF